MSERRRLFPEQAVDYRNLVRTTEEFTDHVGRSLATAAAIAFTKPDTICDPAVGDGSILDAVWALYPFRLAYATDLSEPNINRLRQRATWPKQTAVKDITQAILDLPEKVDTIVLTEILEHLEDPDSVLVQARRKANVLVASSPVEEPPGVVNHEHLWSFGREGYQDMIREAGWTPFSYTEIGFPGDWRLYYTFQIWVAR